ncbi:hypothetical protein MTYP_02507 [Methylophilaceae bacterium]|nr:hypothetical protein MTYP_02507 [Methylophilaceae bacterium]
MKITALLLLTLSLTACNMLGDKKTADARQWNKVSCIGFANWDVCHEKARRLCGKDYDVRNMQESLITQNRSMEIACKQ